MSNLPDLDWKHFSNLIVIVLAAHINVKFGANGCNNKVYVQMY